MGSTEKRLTEQVRKTPARQRCGGPGPDQTRAAGRQVGVRPVGRQIPAQDRQAHHAVRSRLVGSLGRRSGGVPQGVPRGAVVPRRERVLHVALSHRDQHREESSRRGRPQADQLQPRHSGSRAGRRLLTELRELDTPEGLAQSEEIRDSREPRDQWPARGASNRHSVARNRRHELRRDRADDGVPGRHRAVANLPRARSHRPRDRARCFDSSANTESTPPMTEQINDQISAFIDDELSDEESAFLLRRFERDPNARTQRAALHHDRCRAARRAARARSVGAAPPHRGRADGRGADSTRRARRAGRRVTCGRWSASGSRRAVAVAAIGASALRERRAASAPSACRRRRRCRRATRSSAPSYVVPQESPTPPVPSRPRFGSRTTSIHHSEYASRLAARRSARTSSAPACVAHAEPPVRRRGPCRRMALTRALPRRSALLLLLDAGRRSRVGAGGAAVARRMNRAVEELNYRGTFVHVLDGTRRDAAHRASQRGRATAASASCRSTAPAARSSAQDDEVQCILPDRRSCCSRRART